MSSSDATLSGQLAFYVGTNLRAICYGGFGYFTVLEGLIGAIPGVQLYLCFKTMRIYVGCERPRRKSDPAYAAFTIAMLILMTIWVAINGTFGQETWVQNQHLGNVAVSTADLEGRDVTMTVLLIIQLMADGLMMYRCRIVWDSLNIIIIPFILWLMTLALGILLICSIGITGNDIFLGIAAKLGLAYFTISVILTATLTCMICYRLACHARTVKTYLGEEHAAPYFTIVMLLVESVLPLTLVGIAYLVSYGVGSVIENTLAQFYTAMMAVSPQMLILRVAQGIAWQKDPTRPPLSTLKFSAGYGDTTVSGRSDGSETIP